jgi:hypothetical protein
VHARTRASPETQERRSRVRHGGRAEQCVRPRGKFLHLGEALAAGETLLEMRGHQRGLPG